MLAYPILCMGEVIKRMLRLLKASSDNNIFVWARLNPEMANSEDSFVWLTQGDSFILFASDKDFVWF